MNVAPTSSPRFSRSTYPSTGLRIVVSASASAAAPNETTVSATGRWGSADTASCSPSCCGVIDPGSDSLRPSVNTTTWVGRVRAEPVPAGAVRGQDRVVQPRARLLGPQRRLTAARRVPAGAVQLGTGSSVAGSRAVGRQMDAELPQGEPGVVGQERAERRDALLDEVDQGGVRAGRPGLHRSGHVDRHQDVGPSVGRAPGGEHVGHVVRPEHVERRRGHGGSPFGTRAAPRSAASRRPAAVRAAAVSGAGEDADEPVERGLRAGSATAAADGSQA